MLCGLMKISFTTYCTVRCISENNVLHTTLYLQNEAELSELPPFFFAAPHGVNAGGVDAAVSENVREAHDVLELSVVRPGEQVAQVVGKDFLCQHLRRLRQLFEHLPDVRPVERPARPRDEHAAADDPVLLAVGGELAAQCVGHEDRPQLALVLDVHLARLEAFDRDGA